MRPSRGNLYQLRENGIAQPQMPLRQTGIYVVYSPVIALDSYGLNAGRCGPNVDHSTDCSRMWDRMSEMTVAIVEGSRVIIKT